MPRFGKKSMARLETCDDSLQDLFEAVVQHFDCTILCGHRDKRDQDRAFAEERSKKQWPESKHNTMPSLAVDVAPYPVDWEDRDRFHYFAGFVKGIAASKGIKIRWGGDWDSDTETDDNTFDDLVHFEVTK